MWRSKSRQAPQGAGSSLCLNRRQYGHFDPASTKLPDCRLHVNNEDALKFPRPKKRGS